MSKYRRALALVSGFVRANSPAPSSHLRQILWSKARQDQAFAFALLRLACHWLAGERVWVKIYPPTPEEIQDVEAITTLQTKEPEL